MLSLVAMITVAAVVAEPEPPHKLPAEGTWARYRVRWTDDGDDEPPFLLTVRFLGSVEVDGEKCRTVEFETIWESKPKEVPTIVKVWIAEAELLKSDDPVRGIRREWIRHGTEPVQLNREASQAGPYLFSAPGVLKRSMVVPKSRKVDYQKGAIEIPTGREGTTDSAHAFTETDRLEIRTKYVLWSHPDVEAGPAYAKAEMAVRRRWNGELSSPREVTCEFFLDDFGKGAKAAISDRE